MRSLPSIFFAYSWSFGNLCSSTAAFALSPLSADTANRLLRAFSATARNFCFEFCSDKLLCSSNEESSESGLSLLVASKMKFKDKGEWAYSQTFDVLACFPPRRKRVSPSCTSCKHGIHDRLLLWKDLMICAFMHLIKLSFAALHLANPKGRSRQANKPRSKNWKHDLPLVSSLDGSMANRGWTLWFSTYTLAAHVKIRAA